MASNIVRAERVDFAIVPGYSIEFFRFPNGEKRIGVTSAAVICGMDESYFQHLEKRTPKQFKALQGMGFYGWRTEALVARPNGNGSAKSQTLSLEDFRIFVTFAAFEANKPKAKALARGLMGIAIESIARQAFGEESLTLKEIRAHLCSAYAKTLNWLEEDRIDYDEIQQHQIFLIG